MSNIIVTGTNGFLGGAIYNFLSHKYNVYPFGHRQLNLIREGLDFDKKHIIKNIKPETLINFGWGGSSDSKYLNNIEQFDNIKTCIDLFNFAVEVGVKTFIQISSSWRYTHRYGINNYGLCKGWTDNILARMASLNNIKILTIVPYWIYGPNDKKNRFIPKIINSCLKNEKIELHPAQNLVDYLYVSDFCEAAQTILEKGNNFEIYNICSGNGYKIQDIVEKIKFLTDSKSKINFNLDYPPGFNIEWIGDNSNLRNLGWEQKINIIDGLKETIEYEKTKIQKI